MSRTALAIALAALAALLVAGWLWWAGATSPTPVVPPPGPNDDPNGTAAAGAGEAVGAGTGSPVVPEPPPADRAPDRVRTEPQIDHPQGLLGRVVDRNLQPLPDVDVFLIESARNQLLDLATLREQGLLMGPVAQTRTAGDGSFALGLALATDKLYELRFLRGGLADARVGDLRVLAGEWHDVGRVTMLRGTTVRGRVTAEGTNSPVPRAIVSIAARSVFEDAALQGIPGREHGLHAMTGADGTFQIENAPAAAVVAVSASAPGFARVIQHEVDLSKQDTVAVDFALPPGLTITGRVSDERGGALHGVRVEAWPETAALPPCVAHTRADGTFEIPGLRAGPHRLRAISRTHQQRDLDAIAAGARDVAIGLLARASVTVRVLGDDRPVRDFRLGLRRYFPPPTAPDAPAPSGPQVGDLGSIGRVRAVADRRVRLGPAEREFTRSGLPDGTFVAQIHARGWAKTVSEPFVIDPANRTATVTVTLTRGSTLRGRVVLERSGPLAGATVRTRPNGARPDNPFWRMLAAAAPDRITERSVTTDANGRFELPQLAFGDYQLQVDHPDACRARIEGLTLRRAGVIELGDVTLATGALVFGRATANGRIAGQVRVVLTTAAAAAASAGQPTAGNPPGPNEPPGQNGAPEVGDALRLETVTDRTGAYTLPRRVPPGEYELRAAVIDATDPDQQVFAHLMQMKKSATRIVIRAGQRAAEHHLNVTADR